MNTRPSIEEIEDRFNSLPEDIQEAIDGIGTAKAIYQIGQTHRLHFDQIQDLSASIGYLMLGFTKPPDFINDLTHNAEIPPSTATLIAKEVNEKILRPIKDRLREAHDNLGKKSLIGKRTEEPVNLFEQKMKGLFGQGDFEHKEIRPSVSLPRDNDPYRETID